MTLLSMALTGHDTQHGEGGARCGLAARRWSPKPEIGAWQRRGERLLQTATARGHLNHPRGSADTAKQRRSVRRRGGTATQRGVSKPTVQPRDHPSATRRDPPRKFFSSARHPRPAFQKTSATHIRHTLPGHVQRHGGNNVSGFDLAPSIIHLTTEICKARKEWLKFLDWL